MATFPGFLLPNAIHSKRTRNAVVIPPFSLYLFKLCNYILAAIHPGQSRKKALDLGSLFQVKRDRGEASPFLVGYSVILRFTPRRALKEACAHIGIG